MITYTYQQNAVEVLPQTDCYIVVIGGIRVRVSKNCEVKRKRPKLYLVSKH